MRSLFTKSMVHLGVLLAGAGAAGFFAVEQVGCSSRGTSPPGDNGPAPQVGAATAPDQVGAVGLTLTLPGGETIATMNWVITGPNGSSAIVQQGTVNVQNSATISFQIGGIPVGTSYAIALSGTSTDGSVTCGGTAQFSIAAQATTTENELLQCNGVRAEAGAVAVVGQPYGCAAWGTITVLPSEVAVGSFVTLAATATGSNPSAVTYAWSAPSGLLSAPSSAGTNFTCTAPGPVTLTLTVADGPVP